MNPTAIYSKTGKGVQEASGKTSLLKRPDRAVLSAIDGRATLADVAQKCGKTFDADFQKLVTQLDKDGFVREVSAGVAPAAPKGASPAAKAPAKPAAPADPGEDLDFSSFAAPPKPAAPPRPAAPPPPPPRPAAPPPRPAAPPPPRPAAPPPPPAAKSPSSTQSPLDKAREEAEARAAAEKEKQKAQAEGRPSAETEAKVRAEAEAKIKAARDAAVRTAAEAKMKADAEAKRGREEAEKARRESEELKKRLEEETKAREEAERKAKGEAERARKELEDERKRLDEDRKKQDEDSRKRREEEENKAEEDRTARRKREDLEEQERRHKRDEEERKAEEERTARRKREEEEEKELQRKKEEERRKREDEEKDLKRKKDEERRKQEEEERKLAEERAARRKREAEEEERRAEEERAARKKKREEEEARVRAEEEERKRRAEEERVRREAEEEAERQRLAGEEDLRKSQAQKSIAEMTPAKPSAPAAPPAGGGAFDALLSDLDSFGKKDDEEAKAKAEAERKAKAEAERRSREDDERRASEERAAQRRREAEEEERRAEEERAARKRKREEEEQREEEERKAREKKRKEEAEAEAEAESKKSKGKKKAAKGDDIPVGEDDEGMDEVKRDQRAMAPRKKQEKEKAWVAPPPVSGPSMRREKKSWGKPIALTLIVLLALAVGGVHVMPLNTGDYERAASEALGRPVKIGSGRIWLFSGLQLRLQGVTVGDTKIATVTAFPTFDSLSGDRKTFTRIDLEGFTLPQQALADAIFAKAKTDKFTVQRVVARQMELSGPLPLPKALEADVTLDAEGAPQSITLRGPDTLLAKLTPKGASIEFDASAGGFSVPFAADMILGTFGMKGSATRQGMNVTEWDGTYLNGKLSGTANIRWGSTWSVDGVITARGVNAGVFAPALVSEGRGEGTAKYALSGPEPAALAAAGRYDATFKIETGALGGIDLSRALRTSGRETSGRTTFTEMTGQATYDRGAVSARNVQLSQGSLNAAVSADISREGALSGRVVADVRAGSQTLRTTLTLGGTSRDPQFR